MGLRNLKGAHRHSRARDNVPPPAHAQAKTPDGPFTFKETLFDTFHHNPRLVRLPTRGFLLFMIGGPYHAPPSKPECQDLPHTQGEDLDTRILVSFSHSLNGPWSAPRGPLLPRAMGQRTRGKDAN